MICCFVVILLFVAYASAQQLALNFTGDVETDFQGKAGVVTVVDFLDPNGKITLIDDVIFLLILIPFSFFFFYQNS